MLELSLLAFFHENLVLHCHSRKVIIDWVLNACKNLTYPSADSLPIRPTAVFG
ncbi:hypothetical protein RLOC_00011108 [Lonchura striata]|uniref:Uncharacterized protein n=1 Tax=Lonchura striata TaxID=40157 RepID=A0A218VEM3_9PASE|nr:hypothetical protein RLOC_00011108 [Lonchura striata domestica]